MFQGQPIYLRHLRRCNPSLEPEIGCERGFALPFAVLHATLVSIVMSAAPRLPPRQTAPAPSSGGCRKSHAQRRCASSGDCPHFFAYALGLGFLVGTAVNLLPIAAAGLGQADLSAFNPTALGLPDIGKFLDFLRKIVEWLKLGGVALALLASLTFLGTWLISHGRRASNLSRPWFSHLALVTSYVPVALTLVAAAGVAIPALTPFILKSFALAVVTAAVSWGLAVIALVQGGRAQDLARARKAIILAGTPWYCLALWIATKM